jgi:hypothetical protein
LPERNYQPKVIKRLRLVLPGCLVLKNDANYMQGVPDLTVLHFGWWAALEVKDSMASPFQPNQEYYLAAMNEMSFASVIYPENEDVVFRDLQRSFEASRAARPA